MKIHVHVYNYITKPMLEELIPHQAREVFENWLDLPVLTCVFVGIYYGLTIIIVSLATGMTVFTLNIHHKGQRGHPVSPIIRKIFFGVFARVMCVKMDGDYNRNSSKVMVNFSNSYFVFSVKLKYVNQLLFACENKFAKNFTVLKIFLAVWVLCLFLY